MTFSVCLQPLDQVLILWDFLLAYGVHLNIICIVAHIQTIRQAILDSKTPMKILRSLPELDARRIISMTIDIVNRIDEDLYDMLVRHTFDPTIYEAIMPN
jgi:cell cycle arrest protein BUB2